MIRLTIPLAALLIAGCATGPDIRADYDRSADFGRYETYAIMQSAGRAEGQPDYVTLAGQRIRAAIHREMEALGYRRSETEPDLLVNFSVSVETVRKVTRVPEPIPFHYHYRWGLYDPWPYYRYDTWVREHEEGTLMVDIVDAGTRTLVWEAAATGRVTPEARENAEERINTAVGRMFERFPVPDAG